MSHANQQRTLEAYFDGVNNDRFEAVAALFAPGTVLIAPGIEPLREPAAIAGYLARALAPYPEHLDTVTRTVHADGVATVEIRFDGRLENGAPLTFEAVDVFDFDADGRITRLLTVYDSHLVRVRLAAAREQGSTS